MRTFLAWFGGLFLLMCVVVGIFGAREESQRRAAKPAVSSPADDRETSIWGATYLCEKWTQQNSRLGVDEVLRKYRITNKPTGVKNRFWVGLTYRAKGNGLLMASECLASVNAKGDTSILRAESGLAQ
jgi:hypothetical protein